MPQPSPLACTFNETGKGRVVLNYKGPDLGEVRTTMQKLLPNDCRVPDDSAMLIQRYYRGHSARARVQREGARPPMSAGAEAPTTPPRAELPARAAPHAPSEGVGSTTVALPARQADLEDLEVGPVERCLRSTLTFDVNRI